MNMFRFAALFLIAALLATPAAQTQTASSYYTAPSVAALKALTTRPTVVEVVGSNPGIFNWSTSPCGAADDIFQVTPTSGPAGCYTRMATPYSIGKSATLNGVVATNSTGVPYVTGTVSITNLPYEQVLVNEYGIINWLRDFGRPGGGTAWYNFGHANWNAVQSALNYNPTEWQIYPSAGQGKASCQSPGVTGVVIREWGTEFDPAWAGRKGFYIVPDDQISGIRTVVSVTDANTLTLDTPCQGVGQQTFSWVTTSNVGTVNISGTSVTYVSGQPFNVFAYEAGSWWFNGVGGYTCTSITMTTATCDTSGTSTGVSYLTDSNIDDELATFNMQKFLGSTEENLSFKAHASGYYSIKPQVAGEGKFRPFLLGSGYLPSAAQHTYQLSMYPNRDLALGGQYNRETIRIPGQTGEFFTNFLLVSPGQFGNSGVENPSIAARPCGTCTPSPAGVSVGIDTFGTGAVDFTSHSYGNFELRILGNGGARYLTMGSDDTSPFIAPDGGTDANLALYARGSGSIILNHPTTATSLTLSGALRLGNAYVATPSASTGYLLITDSTGTVYEIPAKAH